MEQDGIVGPYNGSQAREVIVSLQQWEEMSGQGASQSTESSQPRRTNRILLDLQDRIRSPRPAPCNVETGPKQMILTNPTTTMMKWQRMKWQRKSSRT